MKLESGAVIKMFGHPDHIRLKVAQTNYPLPPFEGLVEAYRIDKPNEPAYMLNPDERGEKWEVVG